MLLLRAKDSEPRHLGSLCKVTDTAALEMGGCLEMNKPPLLCFPARQTEAREGKDLSNS